MGARLFLGEYGDARIAPTLRRGPVTAIDAASPVGRRQEIRQKLVGARLSLLETKDVGAFLRQPLEETLPGRGTDSVDIP